MQRIAILATIVVVSAFGSQAALAQPHTAGPVLLKEPTWILQSGKLQQIAWFESSPKGGVELVVCTREPNCRTPVIFDNRGFYLSKTGINFPSDLASRNVPIFASPDGSLLMPAWVVPLGGSRTGH